MTPVAIEGVGLTPFGRLEGRDTLDLMSEAATLALADAGLERGAIDGLVTGYSTAMPHLMLATLFAEHFGIRPHYAQAIQMGGATGCGMVMLARLLVASGQCRRVLVVAGENRLTNTGGRDSAIQTLSQVGHARHEVPHGATIPAYYALLASLYGNAYGTSEEDLAEVAVFMRDHAARMEGAHLTDAITVADVMGSRPIATPLKMMDCCPISDGAAALVVSADAPAGAPFLVGSGQAHRHQHISVATDIDRFGASDAAGRAFAEAGLAPEQMEVLGIYDSFTITATMLLEELGFSPRGKTAEDIRAGRYASDGGIPLNTHGGLLSYGHPGVAGGMAHIVEVVRHMTGKAGGRQGSRRPGFGFCHGDGGILSAHVSLVLAMEPRTAEPRP
ncbi:thiolase family protein [Acuticoccus sediminis]|uniref:thiolase family protein n=1 Tax=Acuticoccus sediminis TaxID=2184697 RepID=UPI001CFCC306|nr:thiolase family protein [Acuticoccus sediminis]